MTMLVAMLRALPVALLTHMQKRCICNASLLCTDGRTDGRTNERVVTFQQIRLFRNAHRGGTP